MYAGDEISSGEVGKKRKMTEKPALVSGEDEAVVEVMRWLDSTAAAGGGYQRSGFVTINGNEESCGSSFSDSDSTVMAYLDTQGLLGGVSCIAGFPPGMVVMKDTLAAAAEDWAAREDDGAWLEVDAWLL